MRYEAVEIKNIKPQVSLYTDEQLLPGARRFGITVDQERKRLQILQTEEAYWPQTLRRFLRAEQVGYGFDALQKGIVRWIVEQNVELALPNKTIFISKRTAQVAQVS